MASVPELILLHGEAVETHEAVTEDGHLLHLHRLPSTGPPVLLAHGLLCSSYCWVTSPSSLAFHLARQGFDVWLANFRGTADSRGHRRLQADTDPQFWRFTLHELGVLDLPAMLATVVAATGRTSVSFVGHSMATTAFLILASSRPEVAAVVGRAVLLAPVVEPHTMTNRIAQLAPLHRFYRWASELVGLLQILPSSLLLERVTWDHLLQHILRRSLPAGRADAATVSRICRHARTSRTSVYTVLHYAQMIAGRRLAAYDWRDLKENTRRYGSRRPPAYGLEKVQVETAIFWSSRDSLSSRADMERLVRELARVVACTEEDLGHLDYLWGGPAVASLYTRIGDLLKGDQLQGDILKEEAETNMKSPSPDTPSTPDTTASSDNSDITDTPAVTPELPGTPGTPGTPGIPVKLSCSRQLATFLVHNDSNSSEDKVSVNISSNLETPDDKPESLKRFAIDDTNNIDSFCTVQTPLMYSIVS